MAIEHPQHLALGLGASVRGQVVDGSQSAPRLPIIDAAFHRNDPLANRRQHLLDRKFIGDAAGQPDALEP